MTFILYNTSKFLNPQKDCLDLDRVLIATKSKYKSSFHFEFALDYCRQRASYCTICTVTSKVNLQGQTTQPSTCPLGSSRTPLGGYAVLWKITQRDTSENANANVIAMSTRLGVYFEDVL
jgi:hypothetical protein